MQFFQSITSDSHRENPQEEIRNSEELLATVQRLTPAQRAQLVLDFPRENPQEEIRNSEELFATVQRLTLAQRAQLVLAREQLPLTPELLRLLVNSLHRPFSEQAVIEVNRSTTAPAA